VITHTPNALNTKSVLRKEIRLKMAHESCKSQIAFLEMNGQSVPQRWTSVREGSNTARRQCSAWNVELSAIRRAKILASRESGCRMAHSRQVVRCHPMETFEHLDADSETDAISDIQPVQNVTPNVRQASVILASVDTRRTAALRTRCNLSVVFFGVPTNRLVPQ